MKRRLFAVTVLLAAVAAGVAHAADTMCVVIDSEPPVLKGEVADRVEKGLCAGGAVKPKDEEKPDVRSLVLFAIAGGNLRTIDTILEARGVDRLVYSLHSESDNLITHTVYIYDRVSGAHILGGRTFDTGGTQKNADEKFAREAAAFAKAQLGARPTIASLASSSALGLEWAGIMTHSGEASQFLKKRGGWTDVEKAALKDALRSKKSVLPGASRDLAWCAYEFLAGSEDAAVAACDRVVAAGPSTSTRITAVNLRLSLHRYAEALAMAEAEDRALGFDLFLLSRAWAHRALNQSDKSKTTFGAFRERNGTGWEDAVIALLKAAHRAGDAENTRILAALFLDANPTPEGRMVVESLR